LRAVAALGVVVHHMQSELVQRGFDDPFPSFEVGAFGVDLFFVISGFIMVYSSGRFFAQPAGGWRFFTKRLVRIAPLYWLFTTVLVVIVTRAARHTGAFTAQEYIGSYLLLPVANQFGNMQPIYAPGWTLNYEMFFYVCFALALRWPRPVGVALVVVALTSFVLLGYAFALPQPLAFWTDSLCLEFCYGMALALIYLADWRIPTLGRVALILAGAAAAWMLATHGESSPIRGLAWGLPAAAVVAGGVLSIESPKRLVGRAFKTLGDASYSLYLVHVLVFILTYPIIARAIDPLRLSGLLYGAILVAGSVASALVLYRWVEVPMTRYLSAFQAATIAGARPA
jgi:exopolysaccharide production protein ExoZ